MSTYTAKKVLELEAQALRTLLKRLDNQFRNALLFMLRCKGRVVVIGMGKPGFIAQKISASFTSTGTPSIYLHPAEAIHGDIGRVSRRDVVLILSNSGKTDEIVRLLPLLKSIRCRIVSMTGNLISPLAKASDAVLNVSIEREADPLTAAPTVSSLCMLAMGDALTMSLVKANRFKEKDFAQLHPGGSLGRKLYVKVGNVMRTGRQSPCIRKDAPMKTVLYKITKARSGAAIVVTPRGSCVGIFTDGDLRRNLGRITADLSQPVKHFMTRRPLMVRDDVLASEAIELILSKSIDELPVINKSGRVVGLLDIQDLIREGFVA